ncbi:D-glycero-alpha-D-manno-heptose-1,7-bisphosphate 7-phosphatase [Desulfosoma caldarium]|uniref:D,D-heptose 1,7-bisphosphate phosphatase n=1 Tax=Desulfosoma caldarium TaxID=610254 RepID=A0A3N1VL94_9BACT|nr:HAD-IIIA family hydrolase [Desulfosoma caldarium]ROR01788.1 D-alpha,beta-D-heptose 1,7-bisphosphate phosphatase [Desulfosoma caldarium]
MIIWVSLAEPMSGRFVFLDRDGILNRDRPDYVKNRDEFIFYADALEALRWLRRRSIHVVIISNQSALHRGLMDWQAFFQLHGHMVREVQRAEGWIDAAFYCPHRPDEKCSCRKPAPGMIRAAASLFSIPLAETAFIGDKLSDVAAAENAGCLPVLVQRTSQSVDVPEHVRVYNSLLDAVRTLV